MNNSDFDPKKIPSIEITKKIMKDSNYIGDEFYNHNKESIVIL